MPSSEKPSPILPTRCGYVGEANRTDAAEVRAGVSYFPCALVWDMCRIWKDQVSRFLRMAAKCTWDGHTSTHKETGRTDRDRG